jgi:hypothetical protein
MQGLAGFLICGEYHRRTIFYPKYPGLASIILHYFTPGRSCRKIIHACSDCQGVSPFNQHIFYQRRLDLSRRVYYLTA